MTVGHGESPPLTWLSTNYLFGTGQVPQWKSARASESVKEAEILCSRTGCEPGEQGEVWSTKGILAFEDGRLADAQNLFGRSLQDAKAAGKQFLEARDWVSLSAVSLEQYHYEDALSQSQIASDIANKIGAQQTLVIAQGNAGWAYYETGDYVRALASFNAAAESAASLGSTIDQEHWLDTAGMSEARLGNLSAAREHYDRAMALARSLKSAPEITQVDQALASLLLHGPRPAGCGEIRQRNQISCQAGLGDPFDIQLGNLLEAQLLAQRGNLPVPKRSCAM